VLRKKTDLHASLKPQFGGRPSNLDGIISENRIDSGVLEDLRDRTIAVGFFAALVVMGLLVTVPVAGLIVLLAVLATILLYRSYSKLKPATSPVQAEE